MYLKHIKIVLKIYKNMNEGGKMNERKILFRVLSIGLFALVAAFVLLFAYVDIRWWDWKSTAINPAHTVIATVIMVVIGVTVYITRNRRR